MPEIKLKKKESESFFHSALCNGLNYVESSYGLEMTYPKKVYIDAQKRLQAKIKSGKVPHFVYFPDDEKKEGKKPTICCEDVWMEILVGGGELKMVDHGYNGEYTRTITIKDVHDKVQKTPFNHLNDMINEQDDAVTADVIIQTVFLGDVIFG